MNQKSIDIIVWWIPFRKTRNAVRECLMEIILNNYRMIALLKELNVELEPVPPSSSYKYSEIIRYGNKYNIKICIETGTLFGDAADSCKDCFDKFYTIELSEELFNKASEKFKDIPKVITLQGDSTDVLPKILAEIKEECLFWLDGHDSGGCTARGKKETPIIAELESIFNHGDYSHVILIDDARFFSQLDIVRPDYPNLERLERYVRSKRPNCNYEVYNDIIRIVL